eukprot:16065323-Heterocapsa_arctica.AAC.1
MRPRARRRIRAELMRRLQHALSTEHLREVWRLSRRLARTYTGPKKRQWMCAPPPRFELDEWATFLAKDGGAGCMKTPEIWRGESAELPAFWRLQDLAH